jgi:Ca-activated chloride channel family protein
MTMTFAKPIFLYGLLLVPLAGLFLWWARRRRESDLARLGNLGLVQRLSSTVNWRGRRWRDALWLVVLALLIVALARPLWGTEVQVVEQEGIQVMVAMDVSTSMLAQDIKPDRLSRAKMEIADLMTRLGGDEIGLVLFSGASFIQFPLTSDYATAMTFLDNARPEVISRPGTAIGDAIRTAMAGFDMNRASQKVIVLITDGEDHQGDALATAEMAAEQGIMIYAIGFGSPEGEPIPEYDARGEVVGYKKDQNGEVVLSRLDEATLQQIADVGGGQYFRASADGSELAALVAEMGALQTAALSSQMEIRGIERYQIFLVVALVLMVVIELIPDRLPRRILHKVEGKRAAMHERWSAASGR